MNDTDRKNAALQRMVDRNFPALSKVGHDGRDIAVWVREEVTLTAVEGFMKLVEPASVTIEPGGDTSDEALIWFLACRKLPWEL